MDRTHVRKAGGLAGLSRAGRVEALRARMAELGDGVPGAPRVFPEVIPVMEPLAGLLPGGGLARRAVTDLADCPALIVELISHATAGGGHVAVVGWPELSLAGVAGAGRLENIVVVPDPGTDALEVVAVLVDGLDLVVARWPTPFELPPTRTRPLLGRVRSGTAALVLVGVRLAGAVARIDARVTAYRGIGAGRGRIRGVDVEVRVVAAGRAPAAATLTVGQRPHLRAV